MIISVSYRHLLVTNLSHLMPLEHVLHQQCSSVGLRGCLLLPAPALFPPYPCHLLSPKSQLCPHLPQVWLTITGHCCADPVSAGADTAVTVYLGLGSICIGFILQGTLCWTRNRGSSWGTRVEPVVSLVQAEHLHGPPPRQGLPCLSWPNAP